VSDTALTEGGGTAVEVVAGPRISLPAVLLAVVLVAQAIADGVYQGLEIAVSPQVRMFASMAFLVSGVWWFRSYCRRQGAPWLIDMGMFLAMAWMVVVPWYLIRRERWRGLARVGLLALAYLVIWSLGSVVALLTARLAATE
jgi:hypothetical protein